MSCTVLGKPNFKKGGGKEEKGKGNILAPVLKMVDEIHSWKRTSPGVPLYLWGSCPSPHPIWKPQMWRNATCSETCASSTDRWRVQRRGGLKSNERSGSSCGEGQEGERGLDRYNTGGGKKQGFYLPQAKVSKHPRKFNRQSGSKEPGFRDTRRDHTEEARLDLGLDLLFSVTPSSCC